jgi:hypothetical protein
MTQAAYSTHGAIALISMNNPPVNGLGYELRSRHRRRPSIRPWPTPRFRPSC